MPGFATLLLAGSLLSAADGPEPLAVAAPVRTEPVSYANEVAEILAEKCLGCHSSALAENGLSLEDVPAMKKGGKRGPSLVPGRADESLLFRMAAHRAEPVMPPKEKKTSKPLTPEELGLLKFWIDAGAADDSNENPSARAVALGSLPPGLHPVVAVDLTTDGRTVAAGRANVVQLFEAASGLEVVTLGGHQDIVQSVRFSPDGKRLAAGSYRLVTVWDVPIATEQKTFAGHTDEPRALVATPDGALLISAGKDRTVRVWDANEGREVRQLGPPASAARCLALSPQKVVAAGLEDGSVALWSLADGQPLGLIKGHSGPVEAVAFLDGGRRLATASADATVRIGAVPAGADAPVAQPLILAGHQGPVHALAVSADGAMIASGGEDGTVRLWHAADGKAAGTVPAHEKPILALAASPQGNAYLTGSADGTARLLSGSSLETVRTLTGHGGPVAAVAFEPSGRRILTAGPNGGLKVWERETGAGLVALSHAAPENGPTAVVNALTVLVDGRVATASASRTLKTWSYGGAWGPPRTFGPLEDRALALDFSPDGRLLAVGGGEPSRSGELKVWDLADSQLKLDRPALHSDTIFALRFSPDGARLATASADKFVKVIQVADGQELRSLEGHTAHVMAVDWKADGKELVSGGADNVLKLWDTEAGEARRAMQGAGKQVTALRWVAGKPMVLGASGDRMVRLWNPENGGVVRSFAGASDYVFAVAASGDGSRVAAGDAEGSLFLWNGENGQLLRKLEPSR